MFAAAYEMAAKFTRPVIVSVLKQDGSCGCGIGTFVILNRDGWILTSWHIAAQLETLSKSKTAWTQYRDKDAAIRRIQDRGEQKKQSRQLGHRKPEWVQDFSFWWGMNGAVVNGFQGLAQGDIAVGQLRSFDANSVSAYPVIKDPSKPIRPGTSLCRLGFPFHKVNPTYENGSFQLPDGTLPMPFFPNEGVLTRLVMEGRHPDGFLLGYLETSSPGLRGQSGGPIFDQRGTVYAIQSRTLNLPLGFSPEVTDRPGHKEYQFLNVGHGTHPETIVGLLRRLGVNHTLSDY